MTVGLGAAAQCLCQPIQAMGPQEACIHTYTHTHTQPVPKLQKVQARQNGRPRPRLGWDWVCPTQDAGCLSPLLLLSYKSQPTPT